MTGADRTLDPEPGDSEAGDSEAGDHDHDRDQNHVPGSPVGPGPRSADRGAADAAGAAPEPAVPGWDGAPRRAARAPAASGGPARLRRRTSLALFALLALILLAAGVVATTARRSADRGTDAGRWHGTELARPVPRPDFTLTDTSGRPFDLRGETQGKLTVLVFGYLSCPDICPVQMSTIAAAIRHSGVEPIVIFVTTDPARDTADRLRGWLDHFNGRFIGLRGTQAEVELAQQRAGVAVAVAGPPGADGSYAVGHATQAMVFTADDQAHIVYPFGTRQDDWAQDLPRLVTDHVWTRP